MIENYLKEIKKIYEKGDTREESFYPLLKDFLSSFSKKYLNLDNRIGFTYYSGN